MLRIATLAAVAAALVAVPAYAETSIHVSTVGKTPEQIKAEVKKAAVQLCREESPAAYSLQIEAACVSATVRAALAQSNDPALMTMAAR